MGTAWTYDKDIYAEHIAVRTKAGLMDVSGLKKVHLVGPHAINVLEYITTRDMTKIYPGSSVYACMLNDRGHFTDDCIVYRTGPNSWMVVHGSGSGHEEVVKQALGRNVRRAVRRRPARPVAAGAAGGRLSRQARARHPRPQVFPPHADDAVRRTGDDLAHRLHRRARLRDLLRGQDAPMIWDTILAEGKGMGIIPCASPRSTCCASKATCCSTPTTIRRCIPSPNEPPGDTLWELGLDFTVSPGKTGFRGAEEHAASRARSASRSSAC